MSLFSCLVNVVYPLLSCICAWLPSWPHLSGQWPSTGLLPQTSQPVEVMERRSHIDMLIVDIRNEVNGFTHCHLHTHFTGHCTHYPTPPPPTYTHCSHTRNFSTRSNGGVADRISVMASHIHDVWRRDVKKATWRHQRQSSKNGIGKYHSPPRCSKKKKKVQRNNKRPSHPTLLPTFCRTAGCRAAHRHRCRLTFILPFLLPAFCRMPPHATTFCAFQTLALSARRAAARAAVRAYRLAPRRCLPHTFGAPVRRWRRRAVTPRTRAYAARTWRRARLLRGGSARGGICARLALLLCGTL